MSKRLHDRLRVGIATASLGMHESHSLMMKLQALKEGGFQHVAIGFGDYVSWVRQNHPHLPPSTAPLEWAEGGEPDPSDDVLWKILYDSAASLKSITKDLNISIVGMQPLNQFDGWPVGHPREIWSRNKAKRWLPLLARLGCEFLQVGSNNHPDAVTDLDKYAADLSWLADLGAAQHPPVKIAYESWCFAMHVNTWEQCWKIVQKADHPNLGLCLDVAHFPLAEGYGWNVRTGSGYSDESFRSMLERLRKVPASKIFYVEISDMIAPCPALGSGSLFDEWHIQNATSHGRGDRFTWTVCGRPLPLIGRRAGEVALEGDVVRRGARVSESLRAILETGFEGLIVMEFFEAELMSTDDETIPVRYALAADESQRLLLREMSGSVHA